MNIKYKRGARVYGKVKWMTTSELQNAPNFLLIILMFISFLSNKAKLDKYFVFCMETFFSVSDFIMSFQNQDSYIWIRCSNFSCTGWQKNERLNDKRLLVNSILPVDNHTHCCWDSSREKNFRQISAWIVFLFSLTR